MTKGLSDKIKIASLLCTVMVVYRHSRNLQAFGIVYGTTCADVEMAISKLTEVAVPYFFIISGYFFFSKSYYKRGVYSQMLLKKARTLFLPFAIWNLAGALIILLSHKFASQSDWHSYVIDFVLCKWNGPLWYVRDIMTLMLLVPLYGWIFDMGRWWLSCIVGIILYHFWIPVSCDWISSEGMLFFFIGGVIRQYDSIATWRMKKWMILTLAIAWLIRSIGFPYDWAFNKVNTLVGVIVFWQSIDYLVLYMKKFLLAIAPFSFLIYVNHIYILKTTKVSVATYYPNNGIVALITYFLLPLIVIALIVAFGYLWKRYCPFLFNIFTGGR